MRRSRLVLIHTFMSSMMMLLWQGLVVNRCMRGWRCPPVMVMMSGRRPDIRSPPQSTSWSRMVHRINLFGLRAGPSRQGWRSGPLPTLTMPGRVTSPRQLVTSLRTTTVISVTTLITVWSVGIWSPSHGRAVGPWGSIYHRHTGWDRLTRLLVTGSGRPVIHCLRRLGWGGCLGFLRRVLLLPSRPIISLFDGWDLQSVFWGVNLNQIIHGVVSFLSCSCRLLFCFCFNTLSNAAHASGSQSL